MTYQEQLELVNIIKKSTLEKDYVLLEEKNLELYYLFQPLIFKLNSQYKEDLSSLVWMGIQTALKKYNPIHNNKEILFSTFAFWWIKNSISSYYDKEKKHHKCLPINYNDNYFYIGEKVYISEIETKQIITRTREYPLIYLKLLDYFIKGYNKQEIIKKLNIKENEYQKLRKKLISIVRKEL